MRLDINEAMNMAVEAHKKGDYQTAAGIYQQCLNSDPHNGGILYLLGDLACRAQNNGLAINLLENAVKHAQLAPAYIALGCAYKAEHFNDKAREAWEKAAELEPTTEVFNNLSSLHSDSGRVEEALKWCNKAIELDPANPNAHWNRGLALLTDRQWKEGWIEHRNRFDPRVQKQSVPRKFSDTQWAGEPGVKVAVHGEQGIGDEIMFLSCLHEVLSRGCEVVIEVEPRLLDVVEYSFPVRAYGNEAALKAHESGIDCQIALGDLPALFRNADEDFPRTTQYLYANPERVAFWRAKFAELGPPPYIGVTWQGGTKATRQHERTVTPEDVAFVKKGTAISMQYGVDAEAEAKRVGFHWFPESGGGDINEVYAMMAALDHLITVAQTCVHIAGSLGMNAHVLVPQTSSWRYGRKDDMLWYSDRIKLLRQHREGDWSHPLKRAEAVVDELVKNVRKDK